jgi:hypothetical protein
VDAEFGLLSTVEHYSRGKYTANLPNETESLVQAGEERVLAVTYKDVEGWETPVRTRKEGLLEAPS